MATDYRWFETWSKRTEWCVIDTETTGLYKTDQIVEICAIHSSGRVLLNTLVQASVKVRPDAWKIHGIGHDQLQHARRWPAVRAELIQRCSGLHILAYNSPFDLRMIQQTNAAFDLPSANGQMWNCIMKAYTDAFGNKVSLDKAAKHAGVDFDPDHEQRHRAWFDADLARRLVHRLGR